MSRSIVTISSLSFFPNTPIRSYHAAFFHGTSHRFDDWSPFETKGMDASTESIPILSLWSNQFYIPHFCMPGSWPVVSETIHGALSDIPRVKFLPVNEERTIDFEWKVGERINIEPGNLWTTQLLESQPAVKPSKIGTRYEMVCFRYRKIIEPYVPSERILMELGSPPSPERLEYWYSHDFIRDYPIHWVAGSMVFVHEYWKRIEPYIDKAFFNIRSYELI